MAEHPARLPVVTFFGLSLVGTAVLALPACSSQGAGIGLQDATALQREAGAKRIIARPSDDLQARILRRIGAHEVINPPNEFGERFAVHLMYHGVMADVRPGPRFRARLVRARGPHQRAAFGRNMHQVWMGPISRSPITR